MPCSFLYVRVVVACLLPCFLARSLARLLGYGADIRHHRSFYDAFVSIRRGLFNTRDRAGHTRKRKVVSHTFSAKSISQFEPYIQSNLELFVKQWDALTSSSASPDGTAHIDCLKWFNYLAFDIIVRVTFPPP